MFENVDGRTDGGVTGILIAHPGAFGSGELKKKLELYGPILICVKLTSVIKG